MKDSHDNEISIIILFCKTWNEACTSFCFNIYLLHSFSSIFFMKLTVGILSMKYRHSCATIYSCSIVLLISGRVLSIHCSLYSEYLSTDFVFLSGNELQVLNRCFRLQKHLETWHKQCLLLTTWLVVMTAMRIRPNSLKNIPHFS